MSDLPTGVTDSMLPDNSPSDERAEEIADAIMSALEDMTLEQMEDALGAVTHSDGSTAKRIAALEAEVAELKEESDG